MESILLVLNCFGMYQYYKGYKPRNWCYWRRFRLHRPSIVLGQWWRHKSQEDTRDRTFGLTRAEPYQWNTMYTKTIRVKPNNFQKGNPNTRMSPLQGQISQLGMMYRRWRKEMQRMNLRNN